MKYLIKFFLIISLIFIISCNDDKVSPENNSLNNELNFNKIIKYKNKRVIEFLKDMKRENYISQGYILEGKYVGWSFYYEDSIIIDIYLNKLNSVYEDYYLKMQKDSNNEKKIYNEVIHGIIVYKRWEYSGFISGFIGEKKIRIEELY
ncbi:MAG: hypothetical protein A2X64_07455 [Ignavibacteria bacterium GWF2_33_9]|nr:MAG: hypothetical protein A2X64_07455 [Ignavibacteria bacterium GWF2_33_9]